MCECVFVVFGVSLTETEYFSVAKHLFPKEFIHVGTGLTPEEKPWPPEYDFPFDSVEDEYINIIDNYIGEEAIIPHTSFKLLRVGEGRGSCYFLTHKTHRHEFGEKPKTLGIPASRSVRAFRKQVEGTLNACGVKFVYDAKTIVDTVNLLFV
jgi:hypothetical protein